MGDEYFPAFPLLYNTTDDATGREFPVFIFRVVIGCCQYPIDTIAKWSILGGTHHRRTFIQQMNANLTGT